MNSHEHQIIIQAVQAQLKKKLPAAQAKLLIKLAERYFIHCALEDLKERPVAILVDMIESHWQFIQQHKPFEAKIRVFNSSQKEGWDTTHTIIQIVQDDMPFLVDTTRMVLHRYRYDIHFIIHFGKLTVNRDKQHRLTDIFPVPVQATTRSEALINIEIDRIAEETVREQLRIDIAKSLEDVYLATADWKKMVERVVVCLKELEAMPASIDSAELAESRDFLKWLIDNNFTFLGARNYQLIGNHTSRALQLVPGSGLGVLRSDATSVPSKRYTTLPPQARKMALSKNILIIAKTNTLSTIHREAYTDYIGIKQFNEKNELIGEHRFIGLYTSAAYHTNPTHIPFLRHKVKKVLDDLGFPAESHDGKEAAHILETLPRDDLFQATHEELLELTLAIIQLKERKRIRLLVRRDAYYRYFSCLVYVPREIFTTQLAEAMQNVLMQAFNGITCTFATYFSASLLARIHYLVRVNPNIPLEYDITHIEKWLIAIARSWTDDLKTQLIRYFGEASGIEYFNQYQQAFPGSYTEYYSPLDAIEDIQKIALLSSTQTLAMRFSNKNENTLNLKLFRAHSTLILSDILPILENMGLRIIEERPHEIKFHNGQRVWIHDFDMTLANQQPLNTQAVQDIFQEALTKIWLNEIENDGFNRLVLGAHLTWKEAMMLRAYAKYLKQIGFTLSQAYIEQALMRYTDITVQLVQLFITRFHPEQQTTEINHTTATLVKNIEDMLQTVVSLDEDKIIRCLLELILATIRTNYFQLDCNKQSKTYLSFKLNPLALSTLPPPKPKYEIFVYSAQIEGVHLRAGKVARGGLRWSDRREDFRTEILGLMKAQQVKNTVIAPEGAKGGFVVKAAPTPPVIIACYKIFISGLLDITDNIVDKKILPPPQVVCYDDHDPYLVVAADKGTSTFSDIANDIAKQYHFWLDDAFASGGSAGYDHKKIGITSRGVWVSIHRHFRELNLNPETTPFTVIGIGDMSGDVFGNGMVLSSNIKLIAAFNHAHIFIDPQPSVQTSYTERKRLFEKPHSVWTDYNTALISKGGGVFDRSLKAINITPEMKNTFHITQEVLTPNELIQALLKAPVDLLYNGGIGTFFKASFESHLETGDRTNDTIRINANEIRAKVIAEGGNLGMTQLARVEYSLQGGVVNADFIDNSAGVDCSDHEVNIKILLNHLVAARKITQTERNTLLKKMTNEVIELVLQDNYDQTQMISLELSTIQKNMDLFQHYMNDMEKRGLLDRALEYLPSDANMIERKANNKPLTRPEIAILLAYSKMHLKKSILSTTLPQETYFDKYLFSAFPNLLQQKFPHALKAHSLRKEIIAAQLGKSIIDKMGIHFMERLYQETGATTAFIIKSFVITEEIFQINDLWKQTTALDNHVNIDTQYFIMLQFYYLARRATRWLLKNKKATLPIHETIQFFAPSVKYIKKHLHLLLTSQEKTALYAAIKYLTDQNIPKTLATHIASCNALFTSLDIISAAKKYHLNLAETAKTYYRIGHHLELNTLRELITAYAIENAWDDLARTGFRDDVDRIQRKLTTRFLAAKEKRSTARSIDEQITTWIKQYSFLTDRWGTLLTAMKASDIIGCVKYSVVLREMFDFLQAT